MSSVFDEDTARAAAETRDTVMDLLGRAQTELRKAFIAFVLVFVGTLLAMRYYVWSYLEANTKSQLSATVAEQVDIVARTPFDVILIQVKIGLILGTIVGLIVAVYLGRKAILRRIDSRIPITRARIYGFLTISGLLAIAGVIYAYTVFFPLMFRILIEQAVQAGIKPSYGITRYTEFLLLLTISFGIAAQLPLFMGALSYAEIIRYETFRDHWRYAVLGIFVFGAVFSPPDPFTQVIWAIPLLTLYALSLGVSKIVTNVSRARAADNTDDRDYWRKASEVIVAFVLTLLASSGVLAAGLGSTIHAALPARVEVPLLGVLAPPQALLATTPIEWLLFGLRAGVVVAGLALAINLARILRKPVIAPSDELSAPDIDLTARDATEIRSVPDSVFSSLSEAEAVELARDVKTDDPDAAEAILERWEAVNENDDTEDTGEGQSADETSSGLQDRAVGIVDSFTESDTSKDDIGGYLYDIQFILSSLRSKVFIIGAVFAATFGASFSYLYYRGVEDAIRQFTARVPEEQFDPGTGSPSEVTDVVIALHPIEVLLFIIKFSMVMAGIVTIPLVLYYAWPAIQQRGFTNGQGDRRGFLLWGGILLAAVLGGSVLGFLYIAPWTISYLVGDALEAGIVVSYRIRNFLWLVFFLTVGVGLFVAVPVSLGLLHASKLITFKQFHGTWRRTVFGIFLAATIFTPGSLITTLAIAIPLSAAYLLGIGLLWVVTFPSRHRRSDPQTS